MILPFTPGITPPTEPATAALWFIFRGSDLLVAEVGETAVIPQDPHGLSLLRQHYLGHLDEAATPIHPSAAEVTAETNHPPQCTLPGCASCFCACP